MNHQKMYPIYYTLPALLIVGTLYLVPAFLGIAYSFTNWSRYTDVLQFVGLKNYIKIFTSGEHYLMYIRNTVEFTVLSSVFKLGLGLMLAVIFTGALKGTGLYRAIAFAPQVLSVLIIGITFKALLHPSMGFINIFLRTVGLDALAHDWLGKVDTAMGSIIAVDVWRGAGYAMVLFIAGIQNISTQLYEAASIDGASSFQKLIYVTIPGILPVLTVNLVLSITYGLRVFDMVYVLTNGGPGDATEVLNTATFSNFSKGNYAMGTALSSILALVTLLISIFIIRKTTGSKE